MSGFGIAIRCPATGLPVDTGEKSATKTLRPSLQKFAIFGCSACGSSHEWYVRDAWAVPDDGEPTDKGDGDAEML